ncbi:DUF3726 domain-containing protein [Paracoccus lutimaris]|uniref:Uncharacterized protein DUF3726 n=1 Tax=Paracoccus lutimaris TaxID=1490030 RepID=A0A368YFL0_9RHOB|nr:DUF3726 domain-containing protein [Paracoccus lutimaris]RCW79031.1 uncharacterized protein DUF3726 [Paracoccus lutimaris]
MTEAHDPTVSVPQFAPGASAAANLSRNEIEALCLKAARGAGMPWGLAEEAGFAAGWLALHGLDGAALLLAHLTDPLESRFAISDRQWSGMDGLCPIAVGAALDDHAALPAGICAGPVSLRALRRPVLALPLLARMAAAMGRALVLDWNGGQARITASGAIAPDDLAMLAALCEADLTISVTADAAAAPAPTGIASVSEQALAGLQALAMRTTVPASEQSRRGAGAAASDND